MDNVIPPLNTPQVSNLPADKNLTGTINGLSGQIGSEAIETGQSAVFEVLEEARSASLKTLTGTVNMTLNGRLFEIPVELSLDTQLNLSGQTKSALELKLQPQKDGSIAVKVLSVNGENPEKYIIRGNESSIRASTTAPLINDTNSALPPLEMTPVKVTTILENLAAELKIPAEKFQPLLKEFVAVSAHASVRVNQSAVLPQNHQLSTYSETGHSLQNIQNVISDFVGERLTLSEATQQIGKQLTVLGGQAFPAEIITNQDNGVVSIRTPFAEVFLENQVKLGNGLPVILQLDDFEQISETMYDINASNMVVRNSKKMSAVDNILKIIRPLINRGQNELASAVLNKIPEPSSPRMLANMVAYIKASGEHNLSRWLGTDIVDKLSATTDGREVVSKLGSMFVSSNQDGINWRIMEVPILNGQNLSKIRIAVKKILDDEERKRSRENRLLGTRFVVDTSFSKLGALQFDGFALARDKRFDLIIRTERDIGSDFCTNIMRLFKNTLHEEGYTGTVKINVKEKFIKICENNAETETLADGIYI